MTRLLAAFVLAAALQDPVEFTQDTLDQIKAAMAKKDAVLVDVREQREWDEGHLEGALLLPLSWLREESKNDAFGKRLGEKLPAKKILYLHCRSGGRARIAAGMLRKQGYDARPLKAGFEELRQAGFSVVTQAP
jgi:rhodanese-related sulfurtransferase